MRLRIGAHRAVPNAHQPLVSLADRQRTAAACARERQPQHHRRTIPFTAAGASTTAATDGHEDSASGSDDAAEQGASAAAVASVAAAAAVVGAVAIAAAPPPPPRTTAMRLLSSAFTMLRSHFPTLILLYAVRDGVSFLLHRITQRLTNHVAEVLLGAPTSSAGNPWWLFLDQAFIRANPGYEVLVGVFFLLFLPLSIALNSAAFTVATLLVTPPEARALAAANGPAAASGAAAAAAMPHAGGRTGTATGSPLPATSLEDDPAAASLADLGIRALPAASPPLPMPPPRHAAEGSSADAASASAAAAAALTAAAAAPPSGDDSKAESPPADSEASAEADAGDPVAALRSVLASIAAVLPEAVRNVRRVWWADMHLNARALPLQGLCLAVLPAIWAVPRLLRLQLTLPVAALEGRAGRDALQRSGGLMAASWGAYGTPYAVLLAGTRLIEYVQTLAMPLVPPRWWREVVELPLLIAGAFLLLKACLARLQDLLPLAAYMDLAAQEAAARRRQQQELAEALLLQQQGQQG